MTSSIRSGAIQDYSLQEYKKHDLFCEPGLVSILFLSCGRPNITRDSLASTQEALKNYKGEIEWLFLEQGDNSDNIELFEKFPAERKVIIRPNRNYGINNGLNQLWSLSRGEYVMVHENDWINKMPDFNFMKYGVEILNENNDVSIVQLRAIRDPFENWGFGKWEYSPWSCDKDTLRSNSVFYEIRSTSSAHNFVVAQFPNGFNNNPILMRKSLYRRCGPYPEPHMNADPRHGETEYQQRVAKTELLTAHISMELYYHGRTKD